MEMRRSLTDLGNRRNGHLFFALVDVISILCWKNFMKNENTGDQPELQRLGHVTCLDQSETSVGAF